MESALIGLIVGVAVFLAQWSIKFAWNYRKLSCALVIDINSRIEEMNEVMGFIETLKRKYFLEGQIADKAANYYTRPTTVYTSLLSSITEHLFERQLADVHYFYSAFFEFDELVKGLFQNIKDWSEQKRILTRDDVTYLGLKIERIGRYRSYAPQFIDSLDQLPGRMTNQLEPSFILTGAKNETPNLPVSGLAETDRGK